MCGGPEEEEQMTREDAISCLNMIDFINGECILATWWRGIDDEMRSAIEMAIKALEQEPSVTPKQKMGFDGMTNGEVIDLLFPNTVIYHNLDFTLREMIFSDEWWDEPYKAESEGNNG
jgi:hypothetical protein